MVSEVGGARPSNIVDPSNHQEGTGSLFYSKGFKHRRLTNVANGASPKLSKYIGGSATFMKMKSRLSSDRETTLAETFKYTHTLKANKERFADELSAAHYGRNHLKIWLRLDLKKELDVHFSTDEGFKRRCLTNRTNRSSPRSLKYTGGSATFMKMKSRLSKSLDHEPTLVETFKYTHALKANKDIFADEWSAAHYIGGRDPSISATKWERLSYDASVVDPNRVWCKTASEPYKNRVFGLGSFFTSSLHTSALTASHRSFTNKLNSLIRGTTSFLHAWKTSLPIAQS
ncbi:hypothetical protein Ahy_B03g063424 [Arachis hypogaea]|uniref:Uncharacterized protein n=1 Tax=Arachis hypogaea TaxID=3818 RepID=A0A444ZX58_ARAHY|nr:hypothetical protein Ahy_B03g063424 [Arachis hypogaea]